MKSEFAAAMARAAAATRASNPLEATRIIRAALAGRRESASAPSAAARRGPRLDPNAQTVEPVEAAAKPRARMRLPLRDAVRALRAGRLWARSGAVPAPGRSAPPPTPEGARFEERSFACQAGSRGYKLFVPSCDAAELRGLVVMLHGCKQNPDDFATGTNMNALAEGERLAVVYPRQTAADNLSACWNWFETGHQRRGLGEPAIIAGIAREVAAELGIDASGVFVAGLSAGGAMALVMGETYPELFAAVGVHSGLAFGAANDVLSAFAAMRGEAGIAAPPADRAPRTIVFQGTADRTVHADNAERIVARAAAGLPAGGFREERGAGPDGRGYTRRVLADADGTPQVECWLLDGAGHAWSGGQAGGSYTDAGGPDASAAMLGFFLTPAGRG